MLTEPSARARALVDQRRDAEADRRDHRSVEQLVDGVVEPVEQLLLRRRSASASRGARRPPVARRSTPARIFVPPRSTPIDCVGRHGRWLPYPAGWPDGEKPYRVYSGGRTKGKVPNRAAARSAQPRRATDDRVRSQPRPRRRWRPARSVARRARLRAARRLGRSRATSRSAAASRTRTSGCPRRRGRRSRTRTAAALEARLTSCCSAPTTRQAGARAGDGARTRSCSSASTRAGTGWRTSRSRATSASTIPGHGDEQDQRRVSSSAAPRSTMKTVRELTGLPVNHVVIVDFERLQGPDRRARRDRRSTCPKPILSNVRLPLRDRGALRAVAGLALRQGQAAHGRPARADLLAHPREPARTRPTTTSRAPSASRRARGDDRASSPARDVRQAAVHRRRPAQAGRRPTSRPVSCCSSAGSSSARTRPRAPLPARRRAVSRSAAQSVIVADGGEHGA